ncbi:hypothetical protein [Alicyclobacillus fodiniaquatilis]|uniref:Uncharacterized protein n=1 Tax=Alicyclobacillus fodiniaquatilis TaxID=1661150 RepID=A0ABW4JJK8_9BACL
MNRSTMINDKDALLGFLKELAIQHLVIHHNANEFALKVLTPYELFLRVCETTQEVREAFRTKYDSELSHLPHALCVYTCAKHLGWMTNDFEKVPNRVNRLSKEA